MRTLDERLGRFTSLIVFGTRFLSAAAILGVLVSGGTQLMAACVSPPSGMVAWWPFDGPVVSNSSLTADIAGFPNDGTVNGATYGSGMVGSALSFDGVDDFVEVQSHDEVNFLGNCAVDVPDEFTIDAWVNTTTATGITVILDKRVSPSGPIGYHVFLSNGRLGFQMANGAYENYYNVASTNVADGRWHFITVTVQRLCSRAAPGPFVGYLYVDGLQVHQFVPKSGSIRNDAPLLIGKRQSAFGDTFFRGWIDELEIFKRALSGTEIQAIHDANSAGKCKDQYGSICGYKWNDLNGDGIRQNDEPFLPNWTILLIPMLSPEDTVSAQTDASGSYCFTRAAPGAYSVCEIPQDGWIATTPVCQTVEVTPGFAASVDFGNRANSGTKVLLLDDLGDAPDSSNSSPGVGMDAYPGVPARFPTVFNSSPPGPKHLRPQGCAWLGHDVTLENEADVLPDQDVVTNIAPNPTPGTADQDGGDDGVDVSALYLPPCGLTFFEFSVTRVSDPPQNYLYLNVWFDFNRDGDWDDTLQQCALPNYGPAREWAVQNGMIAAPMGWSRQRTSLFPSYNPSPGDPMWMRITLTDVPIDPGNGADGSGPAGGYTFGETEDYLVPGSTVVADLGDAPDSTNNSPGVDMEAYPGVKARFPTVFNSSPPGPKHLQPKGVAWLGRDVTFENEADVPPDNDGVTNIDPTADANDQDGGDDGVNVSTLRLPPCGQACFTCSITEVAYPAGNRLYVNVWFDFNRDGDWEDTFQCPDCDNMGTTRVVSEWAVRNDTPDGALPVGFNTVEECFYSYNPSPGDPMWMRITLTDVPVTAACGADGSGPAQGYTYGETEDYLVPGDPYAVPSMICVSKFNDLNGNGVRDTGEPFLTGWTFDIIDATTNVYIGSLTIGGRGPSCLRVPPCGTYTITERPQSDWAPTTGSSQTVTVGPEETVNVQFGNKVTGDAQICVAKFNDLNGDGVKDSGEPGALSGWKFDIRDVAGNLMGTVTTSRGGPGCLTVPAPGDYTVTEQVQPGWVVTTPNPLTVTVEPGDDIDLIFGNHIP